MFNITPSCSFHAHGGLVFLHRVLCRTHNRQQHHFARAQIYDILPRAFFLSFIVHHVAFFLGLTFSFISCALAAQTFDETIAVKIGDKIVELEVARTSVEHRTGLMNRSYLPADHGMLFVFAAPRPTAMWMKNTLIDLDAAFIDACGRITQIVSMQKGSLELHHSRVAASRVIEMNAGWFARNNVKAGTLIPALADNRYCKHTSADTAAQ